MASKIKTGFKFIDLFAGIGGFHQALTHLGGICVYACEKNLPCQNVYNANYNSDMHIIMHDDIRTVNPSEIPEFDVLCAGFPCQPFSKAGNQKGFSDEERGDLFYKILPIIDEHPEMRFVILENVRNLADNQANWEVIKNELMSRGFIITEEPIILSPHQFGIPQIRERVYIMGIRQECKNKKTLTNGFIHLSDLRLTNHMTSCPDNSLPLILDDDVPTKYLLPDELVGLLNLWNEFKLGTNITKIGKPIWLDFFGVGEDNTETFRSKIQYEDMKHWKKLFVDWNRTFYLEHREFIDDWVDRSGIMSDINKLHRKFEWNCGENCTQLQDCIIQIRQSGIRAKRPNFFPSLVAMNNTPIVWDKYYRTYRYITPHEASKLQSFDDTFKFVGTDNEIYKQLGNSVNVDIIELLAQKLFRLGKWGKI